MTSSAVPSIGPKGYLIERSFRDTLYGKVYYGTHIAAKTAVVIKEYKKACVLKRVSLEGLPVAEDAKEEIRLHASLSKFRHPYIVQVYDVQEDAEHLYTVLEFCAKGELFGYVQNQCFPHDLACHYFKQLLEGVLFLHSHGVVHRDLSLENLLLDAKQVLKICYFGVAAELGKDAQLQGEDATRRPGKIKYMAPEVFALQKHDPRAADMWSCAVILFVMLVGAFPCELPAESDERFRMIYSGRLKELLALWGKSISDAAVDLLSRLLCPPERRLTAAQALAHQLCASVVQREKKVDGPSAAVSSETPTPMPRQSSTSGVPASSSSSSSSSSAAPNPTKPVIPPALLRQLQVRIQEQLIAHLATMRSAIIHSPGTTGPGPPGTGQAATTHRPDGSSSASMDTSESKEPGKVPAGTTAAPAPAKHPFANVTAQELKELKALQVKLEEQMLRQLCRELAANAKQTQ